MCLYIKKYRALVAENDIVCYKVLKKSEVFNGNFVTPYYNLEITDDMLSGKQLVEPFPIHLKYNYAKPEKVDWGKTKRVWKVGAGYIHSYATLEDAIKEKNEWLESNVHNSYDAWYYYQKYPYVIFRCVIEKGTKYYVGESAKGLVSYASSSLKIDEKLE